VAVARAGKAGRVLKARKRRQTLSAKMRSTLIFVAMLLAIPGSGLAQPERPPAVVTTPHFAFFSDVAANLNDALIAAGRAQRAKAQELFQAGTEKACFDKLPAAERAGWARAVDYYAEIIVPFDINAREQILFRLELMAGSDWATGNDRTFMAIARSIRAAAMPAYERCRWPAQDASNRRWIEHAVTLLKVHEAALGERLPQVYGTPWAGLPYRVDVVESVLLGGNTQFFVPAGPHILISSSAADNQGRAALEVIFHEASHPLAGQMEGALKRAMSAKDTAIRGDISHAVIFYLTGEIVRHALEQTGESYTPYFYSLKLFPENVRDAVAKTLSPYLSGQGTLVEAIDNLVQALSPAGR
jgi:hypothetical protein